MADSRKADFLLRHLCELLSKVLSDVRTPADAVVSDYFRGRKYLGSRDRGFLADHLYDALRRVVRLRFLLDELLGEFPGNQPEIILAAVLIESGDELGDRDPVCMALDMDDVIYDEISSAVAAASGRIASLPEPNRSAIAYGLPVWFVEKIIGQYGSQAGALLASLNAQAPITLRTNRLQTTPEKLSAALAGQGIPNYFGEYSPDAVILERRVNANAIPEFREGAFELQDEGSQLISALLDPHPNWRVFDACAGAGGKTLHLAALMRGRGEVVAHDTSQRRLREIKPRIARSGAQNIRVMTHEAYLTRSAALAGTFDAVLIDAPCTGTGVLRRNPGARLSLEEDFFRRLPPLQSEILEAYAGLVRNGGLLLYATCSLLRAEGEERIDEFLSGHPEFTAAEFTAPGTMKTARGFFRCDPLHHGIDGFFAALLRRSD